MFNEIHLFSGVDFIFELNVVGDFQMYFACWRQRSVCHLHDSGPVGVLGWGQSSAGPPDVGYGGGGPVSSMAVKIPEK